MNQRSSLFDIYRQKEYSVEPVRVSTVEEAIEDYDLKERDYDNLVFSAANLNRPVQRCAVCKLDHAPLKPDPLEAIIKRKEAKRELKR